MYAVHKIALISVLFHISIYNCIFFSIMQSFYLVFIMSPSRFLSPFALSSQCNNITLIDLRYLKFLKI